MGTLDKDIFCPVCGFDFFAEFGFKPWNNGSPSDEICPSCGFQFGLDDYDNDRGYEIKEVKYKQWREEWIKRGHRWSSKGIQNPENWSPEEQIKQIKDN